MKMKDNIYRVLVTGFARDGITLVGRTENNRVIHLTNTNNKLIGTFVDVIITECLTHTLRGRVLRINDPYLKQLKQVGIH